LSGPGPRKKHKQKRARIACRAERRWDPAGRRRQRKLSTGCETPQPAIWPPSAPSSSLLHPAPMDILMVTTELSPYARVSRAGDAVAALTKALCQLEHRVTVAVPRHPGFEASGLLAARRLTPLDAGRAQVTVLDGQLPAGATLVLFDLPA